MIRQLVATDVEQLVPMAREHAGKALDKEHFATRAVALMETALVLGIFEDRRLVATAAGVVATELFTGLPTLFGLWWYVVPDRRTSMLARRILRTLLRRAKTAGAKKVDLGIQTKGNERVARIYAKMGLEATTISVTGDI